MRLRTNAKFVNMLQFSARECEIEEDRVAGSSRRKAEGGNSRGVLAVQLGAPM